VFEEALRDPARKPSTSAVIRAARDPQPEIAEGRLNCCRFGKRMVRFERADLDEYIAAARSDQWRRPRYNGDDRHGFQFQRNGVRVHERCPPDTTREKAEDCGTILRAIAMMSSAIFATPRTCARSRRK